MLVVEIVGEYEWIVVCVVYDLVCDLVYLV